MLAALEKPEPVHLGKPYEEKCEFGLEHFSSDPFRINSFVVDPFDLGPYEASLDSESSSQSLKSKLINVKESGIWSASREPTSLPPKRRSSLLRNIRFQIGAYQRLFSVIVIGNLIGIAVYFARDGKRTPSLQSIATVSDIIVANLLVNALARTDFVVNFIIVKSAEWTPISWPLRVRRLLAKAYEYGGVHSGSGISAGLWALVFAVQIARAAPSIDDPSRIVIVLLTYLLLTLLVGSCLSAHPTIRRKWHNVFELVHRFAAWTSLVLFWILILVVTKTLQAQLSISFGAALRTNPSFWMLIPLTLLLIWPWLHLRKIYTQAEVLSDHAIRLHFKNHKVGYMKAIKLSSSPLLEWHSFATIRSQDGKGFSVLISNAGDWTKETIRSPKRREFYWTRGLPTPGIGQAAMFLFRKIVVVATGSGIGPWLSIFIAARQIGRKLDCRVLWSTRDPLATYNQSILDDVHRVDPNAVICRAKNVELLPKTYQLYVEAGAEAVFVIANPGATKLIKYGMESRGIPAFGPVFDS